MRKILLILALAFAPLLALSQAVPATDAIPRVVFPVTPNGNISTVGPRTVDAANAAKFNFGVASNGAIFANTGSSLPTPGGASVPISVASQIPKATVAAAVGRFMRKTIPVLSVGSALYDLGKELGYTLDNSGGSMAVTADGACTTAPCYSYSNTAAPIFTASTRQGVCNALLAAGTMPGYTSVVVDANNRCYFIHSSGTFGSNRDFLTQSTVSPSAPATLQNVEDAIAAKSSWPTTSALARTMVEAIKQGESPAIEPQTVTGPATSPGPSSVVVDPVADTKTTTTTTNNHTYSGPNVTTTTSTNINVVVNSTNAPISNVTNTSTPVAPATPEPQKDTCGMPGTPACKIDESGTPTALPKTQYDAAADAYKSAVDSNRTTIGGTADKSFFTGWSVFFAAPPLVECQAFPLPNSMGSINPCGVVSGVRSVMAYLWALAGLFLCVGMVKRGL